MRKKINLTGKKLSMLFFLALSFFTIRAQVIDTGDKVGIGVNPPLEKLHVNGSVRGNGPGGQLTVNTGNGILYLGPRNTGWAHIETDRPKFYFSMPVTVNGGLSSYSTNDLFLQTADVTRLTILNSNGKVGIGLTLPEGKLHVKGCAYFGNENENSSHRIAIGGSGGNYGSVGYGYKYTTTSFDHTYSVADYASQLAFDVGGFTFRTAPSGSAGSLVPFTDVMKILQNGNVGIGTSSIDYKLTVNGKIKAEEVKVVVDVPSDFVFESDYTLRSLEEVEKFISENKHLPNVPSAKEIKENGWEVGEMSNKLLEKVEELTLYLIELKKENEKMKQENNELKVRIEKLEKDSK